MQHANFSEIAVIGTHHAVKSKPFEFIPPFKLNRLSQYSDSHQLRPVLAGAKPLSRLLRPELVVRLPRWREDQHDVVSLNAGHGQPDGLPPHSNSSVGCHSRESSTSRFSGSLKPRSRKMSPNDAGSGGGRGNRETGQENWKRFDVIEEVGLLEGDESGRGIPRRCYVLGFVVGFFVLFREKLLGTGARSNAYTDFHHTVFHIHSPTSTKSIRFDRFVIQAGSDDTGVSTDMISINATAKFTYHNTATFFQHHRLFHSFLPSTTNIV